jgi:hypothetical protein
VCPPGRLDLSRPGGAFGRKPLSAGVKCGMMGRVKGCSKGRDQVRVYAFFDHFCAAGNGTSGGREKATNRAQCAAGGERESFPTTARAAGGAFWRRDDWLSEYRPRRRGD